MRHKLPRKRDGTVTISTFGRTRRHCARLRLAQTTAHPLHYGGPRGIGAVGSAAALQAVGQGFESPMLHPTHKARTLGFDSGLVAVLGPGEGVGVDLRVGVHFEGSVVLDAELVVFVDVILVKKAWLQRRRLTFRSVRRLRRRSEMLSHLK